MSYWRIQSDSGRKEEAENVAEEPKVEDGWEETEGGVDDREEEK